MSGTSDSSRSPAPRWRDEARLYGAVSWINHGIVAALVIAMLGSGLALEYAPLAQAASGNLRDWHKAAGVIVLGLGLWRGGRRLAQGSHHRDAAEPI